MPARSVAELLPKPFDELTDDRRELIGGPAPGGEIELWVKDVLRSRVLPLPPFRARQLNLENGQVVLLILVPSSSTTPHLRRLHGAHFVDRFSAPEGECSRARCAPRAERTY